MVTSSKSRQQVLRNTILKNFSNGFAPDQFVGKHEVDADKGMIYAVFPNSASDLVQIQYGVFQHSTVSLAVHNAQGAVVAMLDERELTPQKYNAEWQVGERLRNGVYFVSLMVNGMPVHFQRLVKQ